MDRRTFLKSTAGCMIGTVLATLRPSPARAASRQAILSGRDLVDAYIQQSSVNPANKAALCKKLESNLTALGFPRIDAFYTENAKLCLDEIDRCFRPTRAGTGNELFLCDGCAGRTEQSRCCALQNSGSGIRHPVHTGNMLNLQKKAHGACKSARAAQVLHYANAMDCIQWWKFPDHSPLGCAGRFVQVKKETFDYLWGMEMYMLDPTSYE